MKSINLPSNYYILWCKSTEINEAKEIENWNDSFNYRN